MKRNILNKGENIYELTSNKKKCKKFGFSFTKVFAKVINKKKYICKIKKLKYLQIFLAHYAIISYRIYLWKKLEWRFRKILGKNIYHILLNEMKVKWSCKEIYILTSNQNKIIMYMYSEIWFQTS